MNVKDCLLLFNSLDCKKNYKKKFDKNLVKRLESICKFCGGDINKFCLMLRKGVNSYEYMDISERFYETLLPDKKEFYTSLNIENITDADCKHAKRVWK